MVVFWFYNNKDMVKENGFFFDIKGKEYMNIFFVMGTGKVIFNYLCLKI